MPLLVLLPKCYILDVFYRCLNNVRLFFIFVQVNQTLEKKCDDFVQCPMFEDSLKAPLYLFPRPAENDQIGSLCLIISEM